MCAGLVSAAEEYKKIHLVWRLKRSCVGLYQDAGSNPLMQTLRTTHVLIMCEQYRCLSCHTYTQQRINIVYFRIDSDLCTCISKRQKLLSFIWSVMRLGLGIGSNTSCRFTYHMSYYTAVNSDTTQQILENLHLHQYLFPKHDLQRHLIVENHQLKDRKTCYVWKKSISFMTFYQEINNMRK